MALKLQVTSCHGFAVEHFKIINFSLDVITLTGMLTICVWKDKAAREAGMMPLGCFDVPIEETGSTDSDGYKITIGYSEISPHTEAQAEAVLKTYKMFHCETELDFTQAVDDN